MQAIGLKTHIWNNALKTVLLLLGFPFLILIVCYGFTLLWIGFFESPDVFGGLGRGLELLPVALPIALVISGAWLAFSFFAHQWMIDKLVGAKKIERGSEPRLYNMVENLALSRGLPVPSIRIVESSALNAYASGVRKEHYTITVTRGLVEELDDAELEAVLAHEMTHIINGDVRLIVVAAVFAGLISLVGDVMTRGFGRGGARTTARVGSRSSSNGRKGGGGFILILIAVVIFIIARLVAMALRLAISRRREYMADAGAVELTKNPDAMIRALRKIEGRADLGNIPGQVEALFIESGSSGFWATHPSIDERCAALVRYAGGRDPGPLPIATPDESSRQDEGLLQSARDVETYADRNEREARPHSLPGGTQPLPLP